MSDNCSVMKGRNNGVAALIKKENPKVVDLGCIAHLGNLCTVKAIKSLPFQVDDLLTDIYYHFNKRYVTLQKHQVQNPLTPSYSKRRQFLLV